MRRTLTAAAVAVLLAAGLAPVGPAGGWHDETDLALTRQEGSVMWVVANAVWHHNPWRCTRNPPRPPATTPTCVWPTGSNIYEAGIPVWAPGSWVNEHDNTLAGRVLMTQPWVFHDNPVNWPHGEPDDNGRRSRPVAVTRCAEWTEPGSGVTSLSLNCGHGEPSRPRRIPAGWSFYPGHCNWDEHGACKVPHEGLHDDDKTADWHVIVGVCIDQDIRDDHTHNGVLDAAARAAWAHRYRASGRSEPLRLAHRDLRGWTQTAKDWFSEQSGTNGFLYVWHQEMTRAAIHPLTGHGIEGNDIEDWPLHILRNGDTIDATGDGSTCTCHTDVCPASEGCTLPAVLPDGGTEAADYSQCLCRTGAEINQKWVESVYGVDWETDAQAFARASALAYENPRLPVRWALTGHSSPQWRVADPRSPRRPGRRRQADRHPRPAQQLPETEMLAALIGAAAVTRTAQSVLMRSVVAGFWTATPPADHDHNLTPRFWQRLETLVTDTDRPGVAKLDAMANARQRNRTNTACAARLA